MADVKTQQPTPAPKRKRKTGTSGASNDCSSCTKRGTACDRVRPYCGPCLLHGQECSGYKTVLTWGVGVASRGKLRGKTLPVQMPATAAELPKSAPRPENIRRPRTESQGSQTAGNKRQSHNESPESPIKRQRTSSISYQAHNNQLPPLQRHQPGSQQHQRHPSYPPPSYPPQHLPRQAHPNQNVLLHPQHEAQQVGDRIDSASKISFQSIPQGPGPNLHRLQTDGARPGTHSMMPPSTSPQTSNGDYYPSPYDRTGQTFSPRPHHNSHFIDPFGQAANYGSFRAPGQRPILNSYNPNCERRSDVPPSPKSSMIADGQTVQSAIPMIADMGGMMAQSPLEETPIPGVAWDAVSSPHTMAPHELDALGDEDDDQPPSALVRYGSRSSFCVPFPQLSMPMQQIMDYYDNAICPFLVAVDGPSNPYRKDIMQLALHSHGLQNAMAALVRNNTRMRQVGSAPEMLKDLKSRKRRDSSDLISSPGNPSPDELTFKTKSIELLNAQLTSGDKQIASSDTVLASLLMLCLYHVCNSGFSRFKTQLAGVQKVLRMRSMESRSQFSSWVEMFFAWLDVMTSAVNDRETEIRGDSLAMWDLNANLGALEGFSGCDGRLFKLIARLGRLNLLSQERAVRDSEGPTSANEDRASSPASSDFGKDFYSSAIVDSPEEPLPGDYSSKQPSKPVVERPGFWREWKDIRTRLHDWEVEPSFTSPAEDLPPTLQREHMVHLSEAFRYAALLYIERLAHPEQQSSSNDLQDLVQHALTHIEDIGEGSCVTKFMLWPLFITGTECIQERHRDLIRTRCIEIQKESGFFNNVTGLRVLERVWRETDAEATSPTQCSASPQAFRWRAAMDRLDGEYIVI